MKDKRDFRKYHTTPLSAMRLFCLECVGYSSKEVKKCVCYKCPLYPYRLGKRPIDSILVKKEIGSKISKRE